MATQITGKPVVYIPVELETQIQNLVAAGFPPPVANMIASFDAGIAQGKFGKVSDAVQQLSGRKPISIKDFLTAHQEALLPASA